MAALAQPAQPPAALLHHEYVFVIDTSFSMNRIAPATRAALRELIANGVQQRMRSGDRFELWTFDDQIHARRYPAQTWTVASSQELAARAFAFINRQRFEKQARPKAALAELNRAARQAPALTAIILTDGDDTMQGTPFDAELNAMLRRWHGQVRQARQPFVVALQASNGEFDAWAVGVPNQPIMLPQLELAAQLARAQPAAAPAQPQPPPPAELNAPPPQPLPQPATPPAPAAPQEPGVSAATQPALAKSLPAPPPKPGPPSELAPSVLSPAKPAREAERAPLPGPPARPVASAKETQRPPVQEAGAGPGAAPQPAKPPLEPPRAITPAPATPERQKDAVKDTPPPTVVPLPAEPAPQRITPAPARDTAEFKPAAPGSGPRPDVPPAPGQAERIKPVVSAASIQNQAATNAGPTGPKARKPPLQQTALITPEPASPQRWLNLGLGAGLLALGSWFGYWYVRRSRQARPMSLISQSLERREGKPGGRTQ